MLGSSDSYVHFSLFALGYLRRTLTELYRADADMYPGDEDNGEMAAWFVLGTCPPFDAEHASLLLPP